MSLNYIVLSGQLAQDSEIRYTVSGKSVLEFSLSLPTAPTEEPRFVRVISRKEHPLETQQKLKKGAAVVVEGQLLNRRNESQAGYRRKQVEISLDHLTLL